MIREKRVRVYVLFGLSALFISLPPPLPAHDGDDPPDRNDPAAEAVLHTPPGFSVPGRPMPPPPVAGAAVLRVEVVDAATGAPAPCRVNVVGPDGNFYEPSINPLAPWSLQRLGNRKGKGPFRYYGWFFYSRGRFDVAVPPGKSRVEVWRGFEWRPETVSAGAAAGETKAVRVALERSVDMPALGYVSGDTHIHLRRADEAVDARALDLMEAEDLRFGFLLCMNDPKSYVGDMKTQEWPQANGFGPASVRRRGAHAIASGQEYRCQTYGHICLLMHSRLVQEGATLDPNRWPVFGLIGEETRRLGGWSIHAHGGYAKEIYADYPLGTTDGVELLQFAVYRGVALEGWYHILNAGYRFPAAGASDYPYCRALGDCRTYARPVGDAGDPEAWVRGAAAGRSFFTTGPLLLLEVDGRGPGEEIAKAGAGPHAVTARVRMRSGVAPAARVELIVNGEAVERRAVGEGKGVEDWFEFERRIELPGPAWIAARASGTSAEGAPDAEAHTNPVWVTVDGNGPRDEASVRWLSARLDEQRKAAEAREFPEKAQVLEYFRKAAERLEGER
jgi:hypothetical protein